MYVNSNNNNPADLYFMIISLRLFVLNLFPQITTEKHHSLVSLTVSVCCISVHSILSDSSVKFDYYFYVEMKCLHIIWNCLEYWPSWSSLWFVFFLSDDKCILILFEMILALLQSDIGGRKDWSWLYQIRWVAIFCLIGRKTKQQSWILKPTQKV